MELGFETIGNAILICYDNGPVLATDPWLSDNSYFGSWGHSHEIPPEQRQAIEGAEYLWLSHGHPDHLNGKSLRELPRKKILLPDHIGSRIADELREQEFDVSILRDRQWYNLSDRIRVLCIADVNQDAVLLVDIGGRLVFNRNDASDNGWEGYVRNIIKKYDRSFLLALSSRYGDADMINFFDEEGNRIPRMENVPKLGQRNAWQAENVGAKFFVPFSSMHRYQRRDSIWANELHTELQDYSDGFDSKTAEGLPAYLRYDCARDEFEEIQPAAEPLRIREPEEFGDFWQEPLDSNDVVLAKEYFSRVEHLQSVVDFINLKVGGQVHYIKVSDKGIGRGVTFEAPRGSLMMAIKFKIFDDMLIGNFMNTTLHGKWGSGGLYPDFTPYVAKYADNGRAASNAELKDYMANYRKRMLVGWMKKRFEAHAENVFRKWIPEEGALFKGSKKLYWYYKRIIR